MNEFNEAKKQEEATPLPAELEARVRAGIAQGQAAYRRRRHTRNGIAATAACVAVTFAALNLSAPFSAAAAEIPVLGPLFEVMTIRDFSQSNGDHTVAVRQPAVSGSELAARVSAEIQARVEEKLAEGEEIVRLTKEAFLSTGGTQEEWAQRDTTVSVDYEIKSQRETTVSFVITSYVSVASAYQEQVYYNLDLAENKLLTLADVLGEDWVERCNSSVRAAIAADPDTYFDETMGGFTTVDETTSFYVNENGDAVVVFPRGSIAIGAAGTVEIVCPAAQ